MFKFDSVALVIDQDCCIVVGDIYSNGYIWSSCSLNKHHDCSMVEFSS